MTISDVKNAQENKRSLIKRILSRPEFSSVIAAVVIYIFFWSVAEPFRSLAATMTILYQGSTIGLMAVSVALLMIGGEFDLSAGVAVVSVAVVTSITTHNLGLPLYVGMILSVISATAIGVGNGWLMTKTGIPSFLITLSALFMLFGLNLGFTRLFTKSVATPSLKGTPGHDLLRKIFATEIEVGKGPGATLSILVIYWILFVVIATYVLLRTRVGNWIYAAGGNPNSARAVGVPVTKVKIGLFAFVGFSAWFYSMHQISNYNSIQAGSGYGNEFLYIIAAVVGGCALTGGYGSAIGSAIGALIYGMTVQGIVYAGWDPSWFRFFLGFMLLLAVILNLNVKRFSARK